MGATWVAYMVFPGKNHVMPTCAKKCLAHVRLMLESYMCFPHGPQDCPMSKGWWAAYWKPICSRPWRTCRLDVGRISRCFLGSSEENMMTQFHVNGKTLLYQKRCMVDVCIQLNTKIIIMIAFDIAILKVTQRELKAAYSVRCRPT